MKDRVLYICAHEEGGGEIMGLTPTCTLIITYLIWQKSRKLNKCTRI